MVAFEVLVLVGWMVRFSLAIESQPVELMKFDAYTPDVIKLCPFQTSGISFEQIVAFVELTLVSCIVRFNDAIESQPNEFE